MNGTKTIVPKMLGILMCASVEGIRATKKTNTAIPREAIAIARKKKNSEDALPSSPSS
jgi:hypothetical protein